MNRIFFLQVDGVKFRLLFFLVISVIVTTSAPCKVDPVQIPSMSFPKIINYFNKESYKSSLGKNLEPGRDVVTYRSECRKPATESVIAAHPVVP